jgi:hypothetical protein
LRNTYSSCYTTYSVKYPTFCHIKCNNSGMARVKIVKNERGPPLFTGKLLIKFQNILRNTTQVIVRHRIYLQTDGRTDRHGETSIPPYNFAAGGIIIQFRLLSFGWKIKSTVNNLKFLSSWAPFMLKTVIDT